MKSIHSYILSISSNSLDFWKDVESKKLEYQLFRSDDLVLENENGFIYQFNEDFTGFEYLMEGSDGANQYIDPLTIPNLYEYLDNILNPKLSINNYKILKEKHIDKLFKFLYGEKDSDEKGKNKKD